MPTKPPITFDALFRHRWTLPLIVELSTEGGSRFSVLAKRLGVSRDVLQTTLRWMIANGLARHNPGFGHPLRPEYLITERGASLVVGCYDLLQAAKSLGVADLASRRWSLPVIRAFRGESRRFSELEQAIPEITPRALSATLRQLTEAGILERSVGDGYPPSSSYRLAEGWIALALYVAALEVECRRAR